MLKLLMDSLGFKLILEISIMNIIYGFIMLNIVFGLVIYFTSKYYEKINYRGGLRYENTGLIINNTPIKDYAVTVGFGLPLIGVFSNVNIGFEYGQRGTTSANLVQENYTNITIGFSLNDKWFQKRRFY